MLARWHLPRNRTTGALAQSSVIRTATNVNKSPQHAEPACADESDAQVAALPMARGLGGFNIEPPATPESTPPLKDVREPEGLKPDIIRPPSGTEQFRLCAVERNSVRASDGKLLLAPQGHRGGYRDNWNCAVGFPRPDAEIGRQLWANKTIRFGGTSRDRKPERPHY